MTPKEALDQHVDPDLTDRWGQPVLDAVLAAITTYHQHQVNSVDLADAVERVSRMKDDSGREGCTYGDTDYDSMSAVYGYNLAIEDVTDTLSKL